MYIGSITSLKSIKATEFYCRLQLDEDNKPKNMVQIDDIVKLSFNYRIDGNVLDVLVYGIISDIEVYWDSNDINGFKEDLILEGNLVAFPLYLAKINVLRVLLKEGDEYKESNILIPPAPFSKVQIILNEETDIALGFDKLKKKKTHLPVGILSNNNVCYFDTDYILGNNGAHINISGVSGVAAKTSYATFLLYSLIHKIPKARAIVFNVKGDSLMYLDKKNKEFFSNSDNNIWTEMFEKMQLKVDAFKNVKKYIPFAYYNSLDEEVKKDENNRVCGFGWDSLDIIDLGLIDLMFDPEELFKNVNLQLGVYTLIDVLEENYNNLKDKVGKYFNKKDVSIDDIKLFLAGKFQNDDNDNITPDIVMQEFKIPLTMSDFIKMIKENEEIRKKLIQEEELEDRSVKALIRRLKAARKLNIDVLWKDLSNYIDIFNESFNKPCYKIDWNQDGTISVIDISKLRYRGQVFAIGAILREIIKAKEEGLVKAPVFIFIDELNKYAPRLSGGPLASIFRDIAERGRSFGIILISAQQTASGVDYRVITQSSNIIVGNQKIAELKKDEYSHLIAGQREKASYLLAGQMIVSQPHYKVPLLIKFPLTPWATRSDYVLQEKRKGLNLKDVF